MEIGFATGPVVSESNSLSPEQKRKHKHAWRQSQHDAKKHGLNRRHRRPQRVRLRGPCRPISLVTLGAHRGVNVAAVALLPRNPLPVAAVPVFSRDILMGLVAKRVADKRVPKMLLSRIEGGPSGCDRRTFECQKCGRVQTSTASKDPMESNVRGWLGGELKPPQ